MKTRLLTGFLFPPHLFLFFPVIVCGKHALV